MSATRMAALALVIFAGLVPMAYCEMHSVSERYDFQVRCVEAGGHIRWSQCVPLEAAQ